MQHEKQDQFTSVPRRDFIAEQFRPMVLELNKRVKDLNQKMASLSSVEVTAARVREIIKARRQREQIFGSDLFADPAWDILLELYADELSQYRVSVSAVCCASGVPMTTALRWLNTLQQSNLIRRQADPYDGRRIWIELTEQGSQAMRAFFNQYSIGAV